MRNIIAINKSNGESESHVNTPLRIFTPARVCPPVADSILLFLMAFEMNLMTFSDILYIFRQSSIWIAIVGREFANGSGNRGSIPGRVILKTLKMVLDTSLLNTQPHKVRWSVMWNNQGNGEAPSPTLRWSSYWKGSLQVALDYDR